MLLCSTLQTEQGGERLISREILEPKSMSLELKSQGGASLWVCPIRSLGGAQLSSTRLGCLPAPGSGIFKMKWLSPSWCGKWGWALMRGEHAPHNYRKPSKARPQGMPSAGSLGDKMGTNGAQGSQQADTKSGRVS